MDEVYRHLGRIPEKKKQQLQLQVLKILKTACTTPIAGTFRSGLIQRLEQRKTVKEYLDLEDVKRTRCLIEAVSAIEMNQKEIYLREFSIRCFGDSTEMEKNWSRRASCRIKP